MIEINGHAYEEHKISKLFFRYIRCTPLQHAGVTSIQLAKYLERGGYIQLTKLDKYYVELPKFSKWSYRNSFPRLIDSIGGISEITKAC